MSAKTLSLITGNTEKFEEFKSMLGPDFSYDAVKQDIKVPEYQGAPQEICKAKCEAAARILKAPVVIIDNALCINAWGGLPGSYRPNSPGPLTDDWKVTDNSSINFHDMFFFIFCQIIAKN